jgi:hypothetical protein
MTMPETFTTMVLEPCCEKSEPGYTPPPIPYYVRTPGSDWGRCTHKNQRVPVVASHLSREAANRQLASWVGGWYGTDGWLAPGVMGETFHLQPVGGTLNTHYYYLPPLLLLPFPTVELACEWAERFHEYPDGKRHQYVLYNVTDSQGLTVYSTHRATLGIGYEYGDWA